MNSLGSWIRMFSLSEKSEEKIDWIRLSIDKEKWNLTELNQLVCPIDFLSTSRMNSNDFAIDFLLQSAEFSTSSIRSTKQSDSTRHRWTTTRGMLADPFLLKIRSMNYCASSFFCSVTRNARKRCSEMFLFCLLRLSLIFASQFSSTLSLLWAQRDRVLLSTGWRRSSENEQKIKSVAKKSRFFYAKFTEGKEFFWKRIVSLDQNINEIKSNEKPTDCFLRRCSLNTRPFTMPLP